MDQNTEILVFNIVGGTWTLVGDIIVDSRETSFEKLDKPKSGHFGRFVKMSDMSMWNDSNEKTPMFGEKSILVPHCPPHGFP
jgi:hypothetical protein